MTTKYRHPDPQVWLDWIATIGRWPEAVRELGESYPGIVCYRAKKDDTSHLWVQSYVWQIHGPLAKLFVTVLHGRDSILPGLTIKDVPVEKLEICDCGHWEVPTKEQGETTRCRLKEFMGTAERPIPTLVNG